ncbi:LysR family transcriptional regulator [Salinibacterium sp. SYSU T00001]|uniref:LysR family transcriptional regulator n=1 Tax=Homoserinimonas sedimenticola TaxID=2986805 RepID=UPI002235D567|nr:LysR family transcriptional regulator [Salinibacterium sedimenticola]MCW4386477.1 LysR family transcriptional regulator [Salinibacterium sedimenticola]
MEWELRQVRAFVAVVDAGTFTDAAIELGSSQAAVSRAVAALETALGSRLLERSTRSVRLTPTGDRVLKSARRMLATAADLEREAHGGRDLVRIGYAWSALGSHTNELQKLWPSVFPTTELRLARVNSATAGIAEGTSDFAIMRRKPEGPDLHHVQVGVERRYCALAADDPLAARRTVTLRQIASAPLAIDLRTGSTRLDLWPDDARPAETVVINDVDDWLTYIGSGAARGVTTEATTEQYRRHGVVYRPVRDAPAVAVFLAWSATDTPAESAAVVELVTGLYRS